MVCGGHVPDKGVTALQEADVMAVTAVSFLRIEFLGIYPSLQSLAAPAALVALASRRAFHFPYYQSAPNTSCIVSHTQFIIIAIV